MSGTKVEYKESKVGDWVMVYVIIAALSLTMLGLVMLLVPESFGGLRPCLPSKLFG